MASKSELPDDWRSYEFDGTIGEVKKPVPTLSPRSVLNFFPRSLRLHIFSAISATDCIYKTLSLLPHHHLTPSSFMLSLHPTVLCYALHLNKSLTPLSRFQMSVISEYHVYAIGRDFEGKLKGFYYPRKVLKVQVKVSYQDKNGNGSDIRLHLCHHKTHKVPSTCTLQVKGKSGKKWRKIYGSSLDDFTLELEEAKTLDKYVPLGASVTDLYAGAGVIGLSLASTGKCRKELFIFCSDCLKEPLSWLVGSDVLVVDPPRKGLDLSLISALQSI
ncbi:hypothetical protein L1887_14809 [Cichorium endivia]|nr:hypothetical protein L1887_14809 [Cichorium endivia]